MRRIAAFLLGLCLLASPGCRIVRDHILRDVVEKHDTSRHPSDRRAAYDNYMRNYVDK